jgi:hypothetical protein
LSAFFDLPWNRFIMLQSNPLPPQLITLFAAGEFHMQGLDMG